VTAIYVTVNHYGKKTPVASRPLCEGCTPPSVDGGSEPILPPKRAEYQIVGSSSTLALCRDCAIHSIKSLAARFMMFDPSATRELMDFFAAEATKKRPTARKKSSSGQSVKRRAPKRVIDVDAPLLLEGFQPARRK
jgi:hypothetical protein